MSEPASPAGGRRSRRGREARRALRVGTTAPKNRFITRGIPISEILSEAGLALIEWNAETVLEEIGIEFRDDPEALEIWQAAGAEVVGERVRMARGLARELLFVVAQNCLTVIGSPICMNLYFTNECELRAGSVNAIRPFKRRANGGGIST